MTGPTVITELAGVEIIFAFCASVFMRLYKKYQISPKNKFDTFILVIIHFSWVTWVRYAMASPVTETAKLHKGGKRAAGSGKWWIFSDLRQ